MSQLIKNLAEHILAMADDAHFMEHPEWAELIKEAQEAIKPDKP